MCIKTQIRVSTTCNNELNKACAKSRHLYANKQFIYIHTKCNSNVQYSTRYESRQIINSEEAEIKNN